jgi:hypothetical protein
MASKPCFPSIDSLYLYEFWDSQKFHSECPRRLLFERVAFSLDEDD